MARNYYLLDLSKNQVELLSTEEISADSPEMMSEKIKIILRNDPSFSEAHFLAYLNSVRMNEYSGKIRRFIFMIFISNDSAIKKSEKFQNFSQVP